MTSASTNPSQLLAKHPIFTRDLSSLLGSPVAFPEPDLASVGSGQEYELELAHLPRQELVTTDTGMLALFTPIAPALLAPNFQGNDPMAKPKKIMSVMTAITVCVALSAIATLTGCQAVVGLFDTGSSHKAPDGGLVHAASLSRIIDGDTIAVKPSEDFPANNTEGTEHVIRLLGIDAPEMNKMSEDPAECGAQDATDHLAMLLAGTSAEGYAGLTPITVIFDSQSDHFDKYGRSLAYVQIDASEISTDVARAMVFNGYAAAWYPKGEPEPERFSDYVTAEEHSIDANSGSRAFCYTIGR